MLSAIFVFYFTGIQSLGVLSLEFQWVLSPCQGSVDDSIGCASNEVCANNTCLPIRSYGSDCLHSLQCNGYIPRVDILSCINDTCLCLPGMKRIRDECVPQEFCLYDQDCAENQFCMRRVHRCSTSPPPAFFWTLGLGVCLTIVAGIIVSCFSSNKGVRMEITSAGHYIQVPINTSSGQPVILNRRPRSSHDSCVPDGPLDDDPPPPFEEPPPYEDLEPLKKKTESTTL